MEFQSNSSSLETWNFLWDLLLNFEGFSSANFSYWSPGTGRGIFRHERSRKYLLSFSLFLGVVLDGLPRHLGALPLPLFSFSIHNFHFFREFQPSLLLLFFSWKKTFWKKGEKKEGNEMTTSWQMTHTVEGHRKSNQSHCSISLGPEMPGATKFKRLIYERNT